jgi:hypothetical protein
MSFLFFFQVQFRMNLEMCHLRLLVSFFVDNEKIAWAAVYQVGTVVDEVAGMQTKNRRRHGMNQV